MKLRNQLLALFCLLVFIAFGFLYFHKWVEQKPFGIIIFVTDDLGSNNIATARLYNGGADSHLTLESLPNVAILSNYANDFAVPDTASSASTLATGVKVNKGAISVDSKGKAIASILELAKQKGRSTGLITNGSITDPGVAAFYAHAASANDPQALAQQFADSAKINVIMGGGSPALTPESNGGIRKDGRDLALELRDKGTLVVRSKAELENAASFLNSDLAGIFGNDAMPYSDKIESGNQQPSLSDMVRRGIQFLQYNTSGYVLVVDCELPGRASLQNDGEHAVSELVAMDKALKTAMEYAGDKSLIIVTGRHSAGGMSLNGFPLRQNHGVGILGTDSSGTPSITWATGPNGPQAATTPASPAPDADKQSAGKSEPAAFYSPAAISSAGDMITVGTGPGSQALKGFLDNTFVFKLVKDSL